MSNPPKMMQPPLATERDGAPDEFEPSPYASSLASDGTPSALQTSTSSGMSTESKKASSSHSTPNFQEETTKPDPLRFVEKTSPLTSSDFVEETTPPAGIAPNAPAASGALPKGLTSLPSDASKDNTLQPAPLPKGLTSPPAGLAKDATPQPGALPKGLTSLPSGVSKDNTAQPAPLPKGLTSPPAGIAKDATPQPGALPKGLTSLPKDATPQPGALPKGLTSPPTGLPKDATPQPSASQKGLSSPPTGQLVAESNLQIHSAPSKGAEDFNNDEEDAYVFESTGIASSLAEAPKSNAQIRTSLPTKETKKDPLIGKVIGGRFALHKKLGQGGMGAVYQATDQKTNEEVAVKILPMQLSTDQSVLDRFKRESRVQLSLEHPHIVRTVSSGQEDELGCFLAMELLRGRDFREFRVETGRKKLTPPEIVRFFDQLCDALAYTHQRGIVHRDLKPGNIFLRESPKGALEDLCLIDFGIAKLNSEDAQQLTVTGMFLGTPSYMSPEQAAGQTDIDHRSDVYSVGIILYECLVGIPPFFADNMVKILMDHLYTQPPPLTQIRPDMIFPPKLQKLVERCLAKTREKRPDSILDVSKELREILANVQHFEKETSETFQAEELTSRSMKPILEPEELRQEANKLLKGLGQPEIPNEPLPIEEMFQRLAKQLRRCEEPRLNLSELMMEVLLEDYSNKDDAEQVEVAAFDEESLSQPVLPTASGTAPGTQTIGRMQILTVPGQRSTPSQTNLPAVPKNGMRPVPPAAPAQSNTNQILSLQELESRHPSLTPKSPSARNAYQRKQPDFSKNQKPQSRALFWLLLVAVMALAAIGFYLLQRSNPPVNLDGQAPSLRPVFAFRTTAPSFLRHRTHPHLRRSLASSLGLKRETHHAQ